MTPCFFFNTRPVVQNGDQHSCPVPLPFMCLGDVEGQSPPIIHRFDRIHYEVGDDLADLGREAGNLSRVIIPFKYADFLALQFSAVEQQNAFEQLLHVDGNRCYRLTVKPKCLLHDLLHAPKFLLRGLQILSVSLAQARALVQQIEQIVHRFERIVQLVRDCCGDPACTGESFTRAQRLLSTQALRDVTKGEYSADQLPMMLDGSNVVLHREPSASDSEIIFPYVCGSSVSRGLQDWAVVPAVP